MLDSVMDVQLDTLNLRKRNVLVRNGGRGPISHWFAKAADKLIKYCDSKGLRPLAGSGAEPRLNRYLLYKTVEVTFGFIVWLLCFDQLYSQNACDFRAQKVKLECYAVRQAVSLLQVFAYP